jgi:hypothetical protein
VNCAGASCEIACSGQPSCAAGKSCSAASCT